MTNTIEKLVDAHQARPKLMSPTRRFLLWLALSLVWLFGGFYFLGFRPDLANQIAQVSFWGELLASVSACFIAAWASFQLSVPRRNLSWIGYALGIPVGLWLVFLVVKSAHFFLGAATANFFAQYQCFYTIYALAFFPSLLILWMFKKAFPIRPVQSGILACVASGAIALIGIKFICPNESFWHVLLWHILPFLSLGILGGIVGKRLFNLSVSRPK